jgi:tRNA A37 methylthiotransferase MiaB
MNGVIAWFNHVIFLRIGKMIPSRFLLPGRQSINNTVGSVEKGLKSSKNQSFIGNVCSQNQPVTLNHDKTFQNGQVQTLFIWSGSVYTCIFCRADPSRYI